MLILIASKITMFVSSSQQSNCICQNVLVWTDTVFYDPSRNFTRLSNPRLPSALPKCNSCEFAHEDSRFALRDFCDMLKRREWSTMVSSSLKPCDPRAVLLFCHFMRRLRVRRLNSAFFLFWSSAGRGLGSSFKVALYMLLSWRPGNFTTVASCFHFYRPQNSATVQSHVVPSDSTLMSSTLVKWMHDMWKYGFVLGALCPFQWLH